MDARGVRRGGPARLLARRACSALVALTVLLPAAAQDSSAWTRYRERKAAWTAGLPGAEDDFLDFHDRLATEVARDAGQLAESLAPLASLGFAEFSFRGRCERAAELWASLDAIGVERRAGDSELALRLAGAVRPEDAAELEADFDALAGRLHYGAYALARSSHAILREAGGEVGVDEGRETAAIGRAAAAYGEDARVRDGIDYELASFLQRRRRPDEALVLVERILGGDVDPRLEPYVAYLRVDLLRMLRRFGDVYEALAELEATLPDDATWAAVRERLPGLRGQVELDLGRPERAAAGIEAELAAVAGLPRDATNAERILAANVYAVRHARATGAHRLAIDRARAFLEDDDLYGPNSEQAAHLLLLRGRSELALVPVGEVEPGAVVATLEACIGLTADPSKRLEALVALARLALVEGELERAAELCDRGDELARSFEATDAGAPFVPAAELAAVSFELALARGAPRAELERLREPLALALERTFERWTAPPTSRAGSGLSLYREQRAALGAAMRLELALDPSERGTERALDVALRLQSRSTLARELGAPPVTVADAREELCGPESGVLVFEPRDEAVHVFALDSRGVAHAELPSIAASTRAVRAWTDHLQRNARLSEEPAERRDAIAEERRLASAVTRELLPDAILGRIRVWRRACVVGDSHFGDVPLGWLPVGASPYWGVEVELAFLPSVPLGVHLARRRERADGPRPRERLVLVGGPDASPAAVERWELAALPLGPDVRRALSAAYAEARLLTDSRASVAELEEVLGAGADVLQLLVHGVQDLDRVRTAGLVLSGTGDDDGLLWCERVESLRAPPIVLVTACRSGRGYRRPGDASITDLSGAFLLAGAESVLVCDEDLRYPSAVVLSVAMHASLGAGASPAAALRDALAEVTRDDPATPFELGRVRVVGFTRGADRPASPADRPDSLLLLLGVVLGVGLLALAWRRARADR